MYKRFLDGKKVATFDLDGTLVDTKPLYNEVYAEVLTALDVDLSKVSDLIGIGAQIADTLDQMQQRVGKFPVGTHEIITQVHTKFLEKLPTSGLELTTGFWPLALDLKENKKLKLALATNTKRDLATQILNFFGVNSVFDFSIFGDEVKNPKPHPEIYNRVARNFGVRPHEMLSFEDSIVGVESAVASGASVIVVWDTQFPMEEYSHKVSTFIENFDNLVGNLDQTFEETLKSF